MKRKTLPLISSPFTLPATNPTKATRIMPC